jgi:hypothetical protein
VTVAVVTLALALAGAIAGLIASLVAYRAESKMAVASALDRMAEARRADAAITERDAAVVARAKADAGYASERAAHAETARMFNAALEELHDAQRSQLVGAAPGDVPRIVAGMLQARLARQQTVAAGAGRDGGGTPAVGVSPDRAAAVGDPAKVDRGD